MITYSKNGCWGIEGVDLTKLNDSKVYGALFKLHKYEESGLEPEQLSDIDKLYREKCEEVNRLSIQLNTNCESHMSTSNMNFGQALMMLKEGKKVKRRGWNGKTQYIELATNISYVNANDEIVNSEHDAIGNKAIAFVGTSGVQMGWLASQADMLAEDWEVV